MKIFLQLPNDEVVHIVQQNGIVEHLQKGDKVVVDEESYRIVDKQLNTVRTLQAYHDSDNETTTFVEIQSLRYILEKL